MASPPDLAQSLDITAIAANLKPGPNGIWVPASHTGGTISYPVKGNDHCLALEADSFWFSHRNRCIQAVMEIFSPPGTLFDVGGGNGYVAMGLQRAQIPVVLVEPGWEGVKNARLRGVKTLICSTLEEAGFYPRSLPAVGAFDVLEHIPDDRAFLQTIHRLLVPGGRLYLSVPAYQALWSEDDRYAGHFRRYTLSGLQKIVEDAGFQIEFASYFFSLLPLPIFFERTVPSWFGFHKQEEWDRYQHEHHNPSGPVGFLLGKLLGWELERIYRAKKLPFGGSCLMVARKKPGQERQV